MSRQGQDKVKSRSRRGLDKVKAKSRRGQDKVERQIQGKINVRLDQSNHNNNYNYLPENDILLSRLSLMLSLKFGNFLFNRPP